MELVATASGEFQIGIGSLDLSITDFMIKSSLSRQFRM